MSSNFEQLVKEFDALNEEPAEEVKLLRDQSADKIKQFLLIIKIAAGFSLGYVRYPEWYRKKLFQKLESDQSTQDNNKNNQIELFNKLNSDNHEQVDGFNLDNELTWIRGNVNWNNIFIHNSSHDHLYNLHVRHQLEHHVNSYSLRWYLPKFNANIPIPKQKLFILALITYMVIKFTIIAITYILYENLIRRWNPNFNHAIKQVDYTDKCFLLSSLNQQDLIIWKRFHYLASTLRQLGGLANGPNDLIPFVELLFVSVYVTSIVFAWSNANNADFKLNAINFMVSPFNERRRIRIKFLNAYKDIMVAMQQNCNDEASINSTHKKGKQVEKLQNFNLNELPLELSLNEYKPSAVNVTLLQHFSDWFLELVEKKRRRKQLYHKLDKSDLQYKHTSETVDNANSMLLLQQQQKQHQQSQIKRDKITLVNNQMNFEYLFMKEDFHFYPAHLRLSSYNKMFKAALIHIFGFMLNLNFIGYITLVLFLIKESEQRIERRLDELHCHKWNPDAMPRKLMQNLPPFKNVEHDTLTYESYLAQNNSSISPYFLATKLELPLLFTGPCFLIFIETICTVVILSFWVGAYSLITQLNQFTLCTWVNQIHDQLKQINLMFDELIRMETKFLFNLARNNEKLPQISLNWFQSESTSNPNSNSDSSFQIERLLYHDLQIQEARNQIERALGLSYVNYVIFRREFRYYRPFFKFVALQLTLNVIFGAILALTNLTARGQLDRYIMGTITIVGIWCLNAVIYVSVDFTSRIQNLFGELNIMMAKSVQLLSARSNEFNMISLWRRQLMSSHEIVNTFGVVIFGVELSASNFIQFNSYVLGASLYFLNK